MKRKKYLEDSDLTYELIISIGKGKLSKTGEDILIRLANEIIKKLTYADVDDRYDCKMAGLFAMLNNWSKFNYQRYEKSLPYMTEIFKRGASAQLNVLTGFGKHGLGVKKLRFDDWSRF